MRLDVLTRVVVGVSARLGTAVADLTPDDLVRARRPPRPSPVTSWLAGRVVPGTLVEDLWLPAAAGDVRVRTYQPAPQPAPQRATQPAPQPAPQPRTGPTARAARRTGDVTDRDLPVVVHFHGGGFVMGHHLADWLGSRVAVGAGALVVSVDYRLAPEHQHPAARDDAYAVTSWLAAHAGTLGGDGSRLAVMGESAGATLAAVLALVARDRGGPALRAQVLAYPLVDATFSAPSIDRPGVLAALTRRDLLTYRQHYLGGHDDLRDPYVSPLLAPDHAGLPPALVVTAEHDPLVDDGARYAAALRAAGVPVRETCYLGTLHGFLSTPGLFRHAAHQAVAEVVAELRAQLA